MDLKMTKRKKTNPTSSSSPSLASLPDDIVLSCLPRVSIYQYHSLCLVSKSFYSLLSSPDIYAVRSKLGVTESRLYVCMGSPKDRSWFTLQETNKDELSLIPVKLPSSYSPTRSTATTIAVGSEIYQIGGTIMQKGSKAVVNENKAVLVFDCRSNTWRRGPNLTKGRKHAKSCVLDGKIYVTGGCNKKDEKHDNWGEVLDVKTQTWKPFPSPSDNGVDPNHKDAVFGGRLYVMTTRNNNKYAYDPKEGRWVVPQEDFVGLGAISCLSEHWCVIDNVMFNDYYGKLRFYNPSDGKWVRVSGLGNMLRNQANHYTIQLVNHGGKLVVIWYEWITVQDIDRPHEYSQEKTIWCSVIRLEKQSDHTFCGKIERRNVIVDIVPKYHKIWSCLSVSV